MSNFSPAIAMQFSEIIALPSRGKIATRLHGVMARCADRRDSKMQVLVQTTTFLPLL